MGQVPRNQHVNKRPDDSDTQSDLGTTALDKSLMMAVNYLETECDKGKQKLGEEDVRIVIAFSNPDLGPMV